MTETGKHEKKIHYHTDRGVIEAAKRPYQRRFHHFPDRKVTLTGNREAWIENYKGIIEYTPERIFLQLKNGRVAFCGKQLHIAFYTSEEMRITGTIEGMQFLC